MPIRPFAGSRGPGLDILAAIASEQGVSLEDSYLLEGRAKAATVRFGRHRFVWGSDGREHYLSLHTPAVAVVLDLGRTHSFWMAQYREIGGMPLFLGRYSGRDDPMIDATERWLADEQNLRLLESLGVASGEWININLGWSLASLLARSRDRDLQRVHTVLDIIDAASDPSAPWIREPRLDPSTVDPEFRDLIPLARKWAIDDDAIREERLSRAQTSTLLKLWETVGPRLKDMDDYVERHGAAFTEGMRRIDRLGEATVEARMELERRGVTLDAKED